MPYFIVSGCQNEAVRSGNYQDHLSVGCFCHFYIWFCEVGLSEAEYAAFQRQYPAYKVFFSLKYSSIVLQKNLFTHLPLKGSPLLITLDLCLPWFPCCVGRGSWVCTHGLPPLSYSLASSCLQGNSSDFLLDVWHMWQPHPSPFKRIPLFPSLL